MFLSSSLEKMLYYFYHTSLRIESYECIIGWEITDHCARFFCGRRDGLMVVFLDRPAGFLGKAFTVPLMSFPRCKDMYR